MSSRQRARLLQRQLEIRVSSSSEESEEEQYVSKVSSNFVFQSDDSSDEEQTSKVDSIRTISSESIKEENSSQTKANVTNQNGSMSDEDAFWQNLPTENADAGIEYVVSPSSIFDLFNINEAVLNIDKVMKQKFSEVTGAQQQTVPDMAFLEGLSGKLINWQ